MSLINEMLKDLDKRRGPVAKAPVEALQGLGLVRAHQPKRHSSLPFAAGLGAGLLAILIGQQVNSWWNKKSRPEPALSPHQLAELAQTQPPVQADLPKTPGKVKASQLAVSTEESEPNEVTADTAPGTAEEAEQTSALVPAETASSSVSILTPEQKAARLYASAQQALSRHQQKRGEKLLGQALQEHPRHIAARSQLAALQLSRQQGDKAERLLAEGLLADPHEPALVRPYTQLLAARDELALALQTLNVALAEGHADPETLALRAAILHRMGRHRESATDYQRALVAQPDQALWLTGLAIALEQSGRSRQALDAYRRATRLPLDEAVDDYVKQRIQALRDTNSSTDG